MQRKVLIAFGSVLVLIALVLSLYCFGSRENLQPLSQSPTPVPIDKSFTPHPTRAFPVVWVRWFGLGDGYNNVTMGSSFSINFELENRLDNQTDVTLTFETNGEDPQSPLSALNYINATFSAPNPVTLQSRETKLLTLTVSIADNAPFGKYLFVAHVKSFDFDGGTFYQGTDVAFTVVP